MKLNFEQPTPKAHKTINADVLAQLEQQSDNSISTTFADPPYFLGSEWHYVNGILQIKGNGKDFMGAWGIQNATWWREYFAELFRTIKYGGYGTPINVLHRFYAKLGGTKCKLNYPLYGDKNNVQMDGKDSIEKRVREVQKQIQETREKAQKALEKNKQSQQKK